MSQGEVNMEIIGRLSTLETLTERSINDAENILMVQNEHSKKIAILEDRLKTIVTELKNVRLAIYVVAMATLVDTKAASGALSIVTKLLGF